MSAGGSGQGLQKIANLDANAEAATEIGVSDETYRRMRYIKSHKDDLTSSPDLITYKGQEYSPAYTVEVSENTKRKDFTQEELLEIAEHRYQESRVRGLENNAAGGRGEGCSEMNKVDAWGEAASEIGVSKGILHQMRYVADRKSDLLSSPDLITYKGQKYSPAEFYEMWNKGEVKTGKGGNIWK